MAISKEHEKYSWTDYLSAAEVEDVPTVVQPDIVLCCDEEKISERGITGPPDLVVEVVSPASGIMDRKIKYDLYEAAGIAALPGFELDCTAVFSA